MIRKLSVVLIAAFSFAVTDARAMTLDFDFDAQGNVIDPGQIIDDEYALWGVKIGVYNRGGGPDFGVAFDSDNPTGGDVDLTTPNPKEHATNTVPYHNLLVIQEKGKDKDRDGHLDSKYVPDDEAGGGLILFAFDSEQLFAEVVIVDIEERGGVVSFYNGRQFVGSTDILALGNGSVQTLTFEQNPFDMALVSLVGSGAVAQLRTEVPEPATLLILGSALGGAAALRRNKNKEQEQG